MENLSDRIRAIIKMVPKGRVATYGQIAAIAGNARSARLVAWILHSSSEKDKLPWHRIINSQGFISLPIGSGYGEQKQRLISEGVIFAKNNRIDLSKYLWDPGTGDKNKKT